MSSRPSATPSALPFPPPTRRWQPLLPRKRPWPPSLGDLPTPLLVRMALHTGACEERGGDYFGPPLNRVARLMAAGHGGQTLLSDVTPGAGPRCPAARRLPAETSASAASRT